MYKILLAHIIILSCFFGCKEKYKEKNFAFDKLSDSVRVVASQTSVLITPDALNVLPIDFVTIRTEAKTYCDVPVYEIDKTLGENPDVFYVIYPFEVKENIDFSTLKCALNIDMACEVRINQKRVFPIPSGCFINENYLLYEIGKHTFCGRNEVSVSFQSKNQVRDQLAFILGVFSVQPATKGFRILQPALLHTGNWSEQGMPFYHDAVTYSKIYVFGEDRPMGILCLPEWDGSSAMVFVNKELAGTVGNEERKLDISRFLISGENKIDVKIWGMRDNTIGPFYLQDTLSQIPPSGYCYKFLPSGLYDDFSIVER